MGDLEADLLLVAKACEPGGVAFDRQKWHLEGHLMSPVEHILSPVNSRHSPATHGLADQEPPIQHLAAAELRLPVTVPNPAHAQFISRESSDPVDETRALSETRARQLMGMAAGDSLLDIRDRAILKFYLHTGARIETGCKLNVSEFHQDGDEATLRFQLKGARATRRIGAAG